MDSHAPIHSGEIVPATTPEQLALIRGLFQEYAAWLAVDLGFQGFSQELATLPGPYASPRGRLLLASTAQGAVGCVALKPLAAGVCEMKRLYVRPACRRTGLGRRLVERILAEARGIGYATMMLDTLAHMESAVNLYEKMGFQRRAAYYDTPLANTVFMELRL